MWLGLVKNMLDLLGLSMFNANLTCRIIVPEQDLPASASCTKSHDDAGLPGGCVSLGYVVKCKNFYMG